jgi:putative toxin-antitoxin system antitoxin component (TIGR02293 family)
MVQVSPLAMAEQTRDFGMATGQHDSTGITPLTESTFALSSQANFLTVEAGMVNQPDFQVLEMMAGIPGQPMDLLIRTGVSLEAIDNLSLHGVNAVNVGIINARTLRHRRTKGERLSPEEGDRLYRVSKLVVLAEQVFGDKEKAAHWLNTTQKAFGGLTALEAAATTPGYVAAEEVMERINHGFFA